MYARNSAVRHRAGEREGAGFWATRTCISPQAQPQVPSVF